MNLLDPKDLIYTILPLFNKRPANNMENRITMQHNRFAMERFLKTTPIAKHKAAAVKLNKTRTSKNLRNSLTPSTKPTM